MELFLIINGGLAVLLINLTIAEYIVAPLQEKIKWQATRKALYMAANTPNPNKPIIWCMTE